MSLFWPLLSLLLPLFLISFFTLFYVYFFPFLCSSNLLVTILLIFAHCIPLLLLLLHIIDLHIDKLDPSRRFHSNTHTNMCEWAMVLEEKLQPNEWVKAPAQHDLKALHIFGFFFLLLIFSKGPLRFFWLSLKIVNKASHFSSCVIEKLYNLAIETIIRKKLEEKNERKRKGDGEAMLTLWWLHLSFLNILN